MVFEGIVSDVLSKVLGEYVKNLNKDQLKIGVLGGNVVLNNLELKEDALANLPINLPITVKKGFLGRLELRVPWKDLKSKPVIVNIDNIYALAVPQTQSYKYDEEAEKKKELEAKKKRIENYEWMKSIREAESDTIGKQDDSFTTRLVTKIIDNLQVVVNKVHIRFENRNEIGKLYAVGLTLDKISAQSTDERWIPSFIDSSKTNMIRKLAEMSMLGFYIDDNATSLQNLSTQEFTDAFTKAIPTKSSDILALRKFIIKPISSQLKVSINKSDIVEKSIPKILADCIFSEIICSLSSVQYHTIFHILQFTNEFLRDIKYLKYRPHVGVKESPKQWWRYVGQVTLDQIKQKRHTRSWAYILERKNDRIKYVSLFKRSLPKVNWLTPLNKQEQGQLQELEDKLSFEDIVFYRSLAYAEIKKETEKNKVRKEFLDSKKSERGFFQNLFSGKDVKKADEQAAPIVQLSTNEREELYKTIEYDEVVQSAVVEPPDWVKVVANLDIKSISLQLVDSGSLITEKSFIDAVYSGLSVKLEQRPEGIKVVAGIKQFEVYDQFTKGTMYPKFITSSIGGFSAGDKYWCSAIVDTRPPDHAIDLFVEMTMNPLQVIAPKPLLMHIGEFFSNNNNEQLDLNNITSRASDALVNWTEKTKMQLQEAIDTHKTLSLAVNIQAPVFILPENVLVKNSNALILDLGNFKIRSDMSSSSGVGKKQLSITSLNEDDFYDKFNVSLESVQVLLTNDIASWNDRRHQQEHKTHIINQFDVHLKLYSCIQQDSLTYTGVKIFGELPKLSLHLSEKKLSQLLQMANTLTADIKPTPASPDSPLQSQPIQEDNLASNPILDLYNNYQNTVRSKDTPMDMIIGHKKVDLNFAIKAIELTLSREHSDLIRLSVDGLSVNLSQRTFDVVGQLELNSLDIDDLYTKSSLRKLATSKPFDTQQNNQQNQTSLVLVNFKQFQPKSPEYKKCDMTLDVNFNSFFLVCNPPTIHQILLLVNSLGEQPAVTVQRSTVAVVENRKRVVRTLRVPVGSLPSSGTTSPLSGSTTPSTGVLPPGAKIVAKRTPPKRQPSEVLSIKVTAKIKSLGVVLNQENNSRVGIFSINDIATGVFLYKDTRMSIQGSLGSIKLEDLTDRCGPLYKNVITPQVLDQAMLTFSMDTHPNTLVNYPGHDSTVKANIKSIVVNAQIAYLLQLQNYFLGGMLDPILNKPLAAVPQQPSTSNSPNTSSPSSQSPTLQSSTGLEKPLIVQLPPISRTKLDVIIETPIFIVPQGSDSLDMLKMELGKVVVSNTFDNHVKTGAPIDLMKVRLEQTNISVIKGKKQTNFLQKLDIELKLTRFLQPNHHALVEDILVDLFISHLTFTLDQDQYRFFLDLADNVTRDMAALAASTNALTSKTPPPTVDIPYFAEQEVVQSMGKVVLAIKIHLPLFSFNIVSKDDNIAAFHMKELLVDLISTDRNRTKIQLLMENIVLSDNRKNSQNIFKNLLENHPDKLNQNAPFLNVGYIRDNVLGDQYINVTVNNACLFLSPTPLLLMANFFIQPLKEQQEKMDKRSLNESTSSTTSQAIQASPQVPRGENRFMAQTRSPSNNDLVSLNNNNNNNGNEDQATPLATRTPSITLTFSLSAETTLVENETQPNTRCIQAKTMLHVYFKRDPRGMENAILSMRKVKVNIYRPSIKTSTDPQLSSNQASRPIQILKPIEHIKLTYIKENETSDYWKQNIVVTSTIIKLYFSYDDINTILKIVNNLDFSGLMTDEQKEQKQQLSSSTTSITEMTDDNEDNENDDAGEDLTDTFGDEKLYQTNEKLAFECPTISVLFINESMDLYLPLAELYIADVKAGITNWSSDVELKTKMTFKADYFNEVNMKFEPLIEDWTFNFDVSKNNKNVMRAKFMATTEILNLNVSHAFIQTLNSTLLLVKQKDKESKSPLSTRIMNSNSMLAKYMKPQEEDTSDTSSNSSMGSSTGSVSSLTSSSKIKFYSHWLSNQTGIAIEFETKHKEKLPIPDDEAPSPTQNLTNSISAQDLSEHTHRELVRPMELVPIKTKKSKASRESSIGIHSTIDLYLLGGSIKNVSVDAIGHRIYSLVHSTHSPTTSTHSSTTSTVSPVTEIDVEIKLRDDGSKIISLKSMVQFINNTNYSLELKLDESSEVFITLLPNARDSYSLPLESYSHFKKFWFRMYGSTNPWSETVTPNDIIILAQKEREKEKEKEKKGTVAAVQDTYSKQFKLAGGNASTSTSPTTTTTTSTTSSSYFAVSIWDNEHRDRITQKVSKTQIITFNAPIQLENLLPIPFTIQLDGNGPKTTLECGRKLDIHCYQPGQDLNVLVSGIPNLPEIKHTLISGDAQSPSFSKKIKFDGSKQNNHTRDMELFIERTEEIKGIRLLSVYSQYWLINNSLVPLAARGSNDTDEISIPTNTNNKIGHPILYSSSSIKLRWDDDKKDVKERKYNTSVPIVTVGNTRTIQLPGDNKFYELSYRVDFCNNYRFSMSKVVTFAPRYVIQNKLDCPITIAQYIDKIDKKDSPTTGSSSNNNNNNTTFNRYRESLTLKPGEFAPFHWVVPHTTDLKAITVKCGDDYNWSGPFEVEATGDVVVRVRPTETSFKPTIISHVNIKEENGTLFVMFVRINPKNPPYIIENDTPYKLSFHQKNGKQRNEQQFDHLEPGTKEAFGWDEPMGEYRLAVYLDGVLYNKMLNLKKITGYKLVAKDHKIYATITIQQSSRLIRFSTSAKKYRAINQLKKSGKGKETMQIGTQKASEIQFFVRLLGVGVSLIDEKPRELCYVYVKDFFLQMQQSPYEHSLEVKIGDIQIDNQEVKTEFPVLIHSSMKPEANKDFLHLSLVRSSFDNVDYFRYFSTLIQEMTIEIEDRWLKSMLDFVNSLPNFGQSPSSAPSSNSMSKIPSIASSLRNLENSIDPEELSLSLYPQFSITPPTMDGSALKMVYFALLVLNPISVNITLALQNDGLFKTNHKVLSAVEGLGFTLTKLDRAPITLQGLIMEHPFSTWTTMISKLISTYQSQVLFQFYNILGSIDIIGNPVGLFRNFGTGVKDFFVEPAQGLIKSPADFGKGLAKGTSSLVKNSVYGTFNTISKITGTIGSGVAQFSFDDDYMHDRKIQQARKPKHIGEGLAMGGIGLGKGILQGITGIVTKPVEGAKKGGFVGFAKGLAQGVVGVAVKPTAAVIDATTKATEGIKNTTNLQEARERVRPPRSFGQDNVLRPYDRQESEGWFLLKTVHKGKHSADNYVWHYPVNSEFTVIISDSRVIYSRTKKNFLHSSFMWQIPHQFIKDVVLVPGNGILLKLDPPQDLTLLEKSVKTVTIPVTNENINMTFNMKLDHTLRMFNEKLGRHYKKI